MLSLLKILIFNITQSSLNNIHNLKLFTVCIVFQILNPFCTQFENIITWYVPRKNCLPGAEAVQSLMKNEKIIPCSRISCVWSNEKIIFLIGNKVHSTKIHCFIATIETNVAFFGFTCVSRWPRLYINVIINMFKQERITYIILT